MTVAGVDGVPADASAVVANVTVAGSSGPGFLTVFPAPASGAPTPPTASNVNFTTGQVIANRVIIPVGANGQIEVYNNSGSVKVDVDLDGYYTGSSGELGSAFTPMNPARVTDTRIGTNGSVTRWQRQRELQLSQRGSLFHGDRVGRQCDRGGRRSGGVLDRLSDDRLHSARGERRQLHSQCDRAELHPGPTQWCRHLSLQQQRRSGEHHHRRLWVLLTASSGCNRHRQSRRASLPAEPPPPLITVTVTTGSGVAFNDPVTLTTTPSVTDPSSCGTATAPGSTNASGQVTSTYTPSVTAGTCTITATEGNNGTSGSVVITQT